MCSNICREAPLLTYDSDVEGTFFFGHFDCFVGVRTLHHFVFRMWLLDSLNDSSSLTHFSFDAITFNFCCFYFLIQIYYKLDHNNDYWSDNYSFHAPSIDGIQFRFLNDEHED